jgi:hypothetical protein
LDSLRGIGRLICAVFVQVSYHSAQVHFCISCLEAAFHRRLHQLLELRAACALEEKIRIAAEVFDRRERDCIDPVLDHDLAAAWKSGDPMRERTFVIT